jgi:predicted ArsR family transcriptional regulator
MDPGLSAGTHHVVAVPVLHEEGLSVEERVLGLLAEGSLATEQIAANLRVAEATVRVTLDVLRESSLVDMSPITQFTGVTGTAAAYWRITEAGRARLEQLRAESE